MLYIVPLLAIPALPSRPLLVPLQSLREAPRFSLPPPPPPSRPLLLGEGWLHPTQVEKQVSPVSLVMSLARTVLRSGTNMAQFIHSSMQPATGPPNGTQCDELADIFPCPPPFSWRPGHPPHSPRRRQRFHRTQAAQLWTNLIFAVCSWNGVCQSSGCPAHAREGRALTQEQTSARARVLALTISLARFPWSGSGGLKLDALQGCRRPSFSRADTASLTLARRIKHPPCSASS